MASMDESCNAYTKKRLTVVGDAVVDDEVDVFPETFSSQVEMTSTVLWGR